MRVPGALTIDRYTLGATKSTLFALTIVACACSRDRNSTASDGIEYSWMLDSASVVVLADDGDNSGPKPGVVTSLLSTENGGILIGDGALNTLYFFDSTGKYLKSIGRSGSGPAEFRRLVGITRCESRGFIAADLGVKLMQLSDAGELVATYPTPMSAHRLIGCTRPDEIMLQQDGSGRVPEGGGLHRLTTAIIKYSTKTGATDTIDTFSGTEYFFSQRGPYYLDLPLGATTLASLGRRWLFVLENDKPVVHAIRVDSTERRSFHLELDRRPMDRSLFDRALEERLAQITSEEVRKVVSPIRDELPLPEYLPYADRLLADDSDRVWLRTFDSTDTTSVTWWAFSTNGQMLGTFSAPSNLEITEIRDSRVLGVLRLEGGGESARSYSLLSTR